MTEIRRRRLVAAASADRPRSPSRRARRAWLAVALLVAAAGLHVVGPAPASAAVTRLHGFRATVDGWTSWYGSYGMGQLGPGWCIDHGSRAPDPAFRYAPTDLASVPPDVRAAIGWVVGRHGQGSDAVTHAAVMLAVHDLMGARYPSGRLDVDRLTPARLAGFGDHTDAVLVRARQLKADGLAHRHLRGPLVLRLALGERDAEGRVPVTARITDQAGAGVGGQVVTVAWPGHEQRLTTGPDGRATTAAPASGTATPVRASALVPRLPVDAWASTTTPAQRVARPTLDHLDAVAEVPPGTGRLRIHKTGDATAWVPVTGARFEVTPVEGGAAVEMVVGPDDRTEPVELPIGRHQVVEVEPPPGYQVAGPWTVEVRPGAETVHEVHDEVERSRISLRKVDAATGAPLAFAGLTLRYDADADGVFDGPGDPIVAEVLSTREPIELEDLLPGRYELREDLTPTGYQPLAEPLVVELDPGEELELDVPNEAVPPSVPPVAEPPTTEPPPTTERPDAEPPPTTEVPDAQPPAPAPPTTTAPLPTTAAPAPPVTVASAPPMRPSAALPRTGADTASLALAGAGLVLLGWAGLDAGRRRTERWPRRGGLTSRRVG